MGGAGREFVVDEIHGSMQRALGGPVVAEVGPVVGVGEALAQLDARGRRPVAVDFDAAQVGCGGREAGEQGAECVPVGGGAREENAADAGAERAQQQRLGAGGQHRVVGAVEHEAPRAQLAREEWEGFLSDLARHAQDGQVDALSAPDADEGAAD